VFFRASVSMNRGKLLLQVAKYDVLSAVSVVLQAQNVLKSLAFRGDGGELHDRRFPRPLIAWSLCTLQKPTPSAPRFSRLWRFTSLLHSLTYATHARVCLQTQHCVALHCILRLCRRLALNLTFTPHISNSPGSWNSEC